MSDATEQPRPHAYLEAARESVTMALYQSLSLLAVLLATPTPSTEDTRAQVSITVLLTGLGLLAAHHLAFRLSSRLINQGLLTDESRELLAAQAKGGLPIVVAAAIPPLLFGVEWGTVISELLLVALVAVVGYRSVRPATTRRRAMLYLAALLVLVVGVIGLKLAVGH